MPMGVVVIESDKFAGVSVVKSVNYLENLNVVISLSSIYSNVGKLSAQSLSS